MRRRSAQTSCPNSSALSQELSNLIDLLTDLAARSHQHLNRYSRDADNLSQLHQDLTTALLAIKTLRFSGARIPDPKADYDR